MSSDKRDIKHLYDASLVVGDSIGVNTNKKKGIIVSVLALAFLLYVTIMCSMLHHTIIAACSGLLSIFVLVASIRYARTPNPLLVIDKTGIQYYGKFYGWENIDAISCVWDEDGKKITDVRCHLTNKKYVSIQTGFLEQPVGVWANYIIKYSKK